MSQQPNVLFIITDQQRADHAGFMGNDVVRTPAIDSIAARGNVFESAWVANPVCMPNRSSIMTGRYPTAHGVVFNDRSLDWNATTFPRLMRAAGYRTGLIGKSHLQHGMSRNSVVEIEGEPVARSPYPDGWDELEEFERYLDDWEDPDDFYGFDHIELAIDHGARMTGHHLRWALDKGGKLDELLVPYSPESPALDRSDRWWQIYRPPYGPELHSTTFVAERAVAFIDEAAAEQKPWLAYCSFPDPHHPMAAPGEWYDRHRPPTWCCPRVSTTRWPTVRRTCVGLQSFTAEQQRMWVSAFGAGDHEMVKEAIAATYGVVEMIDDGVAQILAAVERLGQADNTIIVFTSDHGDMMGEHGLMMKGFMPFRGTQQVPLIISAPGVAPSRSSSLASSIDLAPTLLDLCGLNPFDGIQGTSLVPVMDDPTVAVRDHVLVEEHCPPGLAAGRIPEKSRTVVTPALRYTRNSRGEELLFDEVEDRDEMTNLANSEPARRAEGVEAMMDALMEADDLARGAPIA